MTNQLTKSIYIQFIAIIISALIGVYFDLLWMCLAATSLILLVGNLNQLLQLSTWLQNKRLPSPPSVNSAWQTIYDGFFKRVERHREKRKELNFHIRKFREGAESLPDATVVLGPEFRIEWSNTNAKLLLGISWPKDSGKKLIKAINSPELQEFLLTSTFSEVPSIFVYSTEHQELEMRFTTYGEKQFLLMVRDVSQLKRIEKMRRDFVANVSHELKTPLTVMRGYVEILSDDDGLPEIWKSSFSAVEQQVSRMDRLVEQLLTLSRTEIHGEQENRQRINVAKLINRIVEENSWLINEKRHNIVVDVDKRVSLWGIEVDIKSAFTNLIVNAVNYTQAKGKIVISWRKAGEQCIFSVQDNGCGILDSDIDRLTERFYRVDKSRSRNTGGSGLGLAIVKHVANLHNARLVIDSDYGKGSNFRLIFDAKDSYVQ
ncbi:phosphate regulon sensor histidine kinase PhoR [Thalassotalea crassostreae]|uniref:phosphate regulon sensor histidine kinase PhoR n=1 Tax=Thalassotalea crassostreae TaxID=1763536 RepID=UPI000837D1A9|nr:phosphate regulon sensor histidine kinase PhoR [Thalassotalea crassostreae]